MTPVLVTDKAVPAAAASRDGPDAYLPDAIIDDLPELLDIVGVASP
jgi:hypothetical protein